MNTKPNDRAALDAARADFAEAMMNARDNPQDADAQRRLHAATQDGRRAWKAFRDAATADMAAQIDALVPDAFKGESGDVPQE